MTRDELQTLMKLCGQATPGPWHVEYDPHPEGIVNLVRSVQTGTAICGVRNKLDAALIVTLRTILLEWGDDFEALSAILYADYFEEFEQLNAESDEYRQGFQHALAMIRQRAGLFVPEPHVADV